MDSCARTDQPNLGSCIRLRQVSALTINLQRRLTNGVMFTAQTSLDWQRFEINLHPSQEQSGLLSRINSGTESKCIELLADGQVLGTAELLQLATGIVWDSNWKIETRDYILKAAQHLWDRDLYMAMGGQLQLSASIVRCAEKMLVFHLVLVCSISSQRYTHILAATPNAMSSWLENPCWQTLPSSAVDLSVHALSEISCVGNFLIGNTQLNMQSLAQLKEGDAIFIEQDTSSKHDHRTMRLTFGGWVLSISKSTSEAEWILEKLERLEKMQTHNLLDIASTENSQNDDGLNKLSDIPVVLHFSAGNVSMTIRELMSLKTGEVVNLNQAVTTQVTISVNQQIIGKGELIDIDGRLAVQIIELVLKS